MLSISRESEGYDKGNIVMKDVAVTMGMFCALRLSLKPLIHTRSYVSLRSKRFCEERGKRVKSFICGHRLVLCAFFASWLVSSLRSRR